MTRTTRDRALPHRSTFRPLPRAPIPGAARFRGPTHRHRESQLRPGPSSRMKTALYAISGWSPALIGLLSSLIVLCGSFCSFVSSAGGEEEHEATTHPQRRAHTAQARRHTWQPTDESTLSSSLPRTRSRRRTACAGHHAGADRADGREKMPSSS